MAKSLQGGWRDFGVIATEVLDDLVFRIFGHSVIDPINLTTYQATLDAADIDVFLAQHFDYSDEADDSQAFAVSFAGTVSHLSAKVTSNGRDVETTIAVQFDGVDSDCVLVIPPRQTGDFVGTTSASFTAGMKIQGILRSPSVYSNDDDEDGTIDSLDSDDDGDGIPDADDDDFPESFTIAIEAIQVVVEPASGQVSIFVTNPLDSLQLGITSGLGKFYYPLTVDGDSSYWTGLVDDRESYADLVTARATVEPHTKFNTRIGAGTIQNFQFFVTRNGVSDQTLSGNLTLVVNGVDTAISVDIPSATQGRFTDASTVAIADGDQLGLALYWPYLTGVSDTIAIAWAGFEIATAGETADIMAVRGGEETPTQYVAGLQMIGGDNVDTGEVDGDGNAIYEFQDPRPAPRDSYFPYLTTVPTTIEVVEDDIAVAVPACMRFSRMRFYVGFFSGDPIVMRSRVDGANGNQTVTINGTGLFEDTTNHDDITCNKRFCYQGLVGADATSTLMRIDWIGTTVQATPGVSECTCPEGNCSHRCPDLSMMLDELASRALVMCGEDPDAPVYWSEDEMKRYVNDTYVEFCKQTKALEVIEAIELAADSEAGVLSDNVAQIFRVTFDDRKIENTTKWELDRQEINWENLSGYVDAYITTLQDNRTITTFKAWDGTAVNAEGLIFDGAYDYVQWSAGETYDAGTRVVNTVDGIVKGFVASADHGSGIGNEPGVGGSWEVVWIPLALVVWATKHPDPMIEPGCEDEPELPPWTHLALAYGAASKALRRRGEQGNAAVADAYEAMAMEYGKLLAGIVGNRAPEQTWAMGRGRNQRRRPQPWDRLIEEP